MERGVTFPTWLVVFGQSQCTVPVGQSEQTALVSKKACHSLFKANHKTNLGVLWVKQSDIFCNCLQKMFFKIHKKRHKLSVTILSLGVGVFHD